MFVFMFLGAFISMKLVTSNPLAQSIQTCPGANYQQIQPYETFVIQPGNYQPYPLLIQDPYNQPSLSEQISQIFWEKLLSHPSVRSILDTHNIYDQNLNTQTNPPSPYNPYKTEVVNNYIVVSSDHITINETEQSPKANAIRNDLYASNKANLVKDFKRRQDRVTDNKRKKKVLDPNDERVAVLNPDKPRKVKKNLDINTFSIENIKCYTPAEVLDEGVKSPVRKNCRNKEQKKKGQKRKQPNKAKSEKDSKTASKKSTKRNKANKNIKGNCKETKENISTKTPNARKHKKEQDGVNKCDCKKMSDIIENKSKVQETTIRNCDEEIDELFNLNQYCSALENRCTRNSKHDSVKDSRNKHSDLPDDISVNYASYINDLFSNTKAPNSNLFYGSNMYPFDFSQMYQIPQYSNIDISKQQGNKSKKRKKKQKKKNSTRKKKEEYNNNTDEKVTKKTNKNNVENVNINNNNNNIENDSLKNNDKNDFFSKIGNDINVESVIKKPEVINELENVEVTTKTVNITETTTTIPITPTTILTEITTEKSTTTVTSSAEPYSIIEDSESFEEPGQQVEIIQTVGTEDRKQNLISTDSPKEIKIKIYEKRIPETNGMINKDAIELLESADRIKEESYEQSSIDPYNINKVSTIGFLDGIPSIFHDEIIDDYYPDFTADNHAYLVSEEIDLRNIHDRYFYTTHKNIDSETFKIPDLTRLSENTGHGIHNDRTDEIDDKRYKLRDGLDEVEHNENRSKFKDEDITFMTPPGLDIPGFLTRKINIDKENSNEIFYQHNDYKHFDNFADKSDHSFKTEKYENGRDKQGSVVETVYARSKVVKYGQGQNFETSWKENKTLEDGVKKNGKTIVIAKSISPDDFWKYQ